MMTTNARRRPVPIVPYLILGVWALGSLYPYLWMLGSALKSPEEFFDGGVSPIPTAPYLSNFREVWEDGFAGYFVNTVLVSAGAIVVAIVAASLFGYALARLRFAGRGLMIGLIGLLLFLPPTYNVIPIVTMVTTLGLNDSLVGVILVLGTYALPLAIMLYFAYFRTLPEALDEAARLDGAGTWRSYLSIAMPLATPITVTVALLTLVSTWNNVVVPLILTLGAPELRTLAVGLYAYNGTHLAQYTLICAGAALAVLPIVGVFLFLQRYFVAGMSGAFK
jgi:raffinose/stachyose/melibiose transport system permease protein